MRYRDVACIVAKAGPGHTPSCAIRAWLGGHSLLATQRVSLSEATTNVPLAPVDVAVPKLLFHFVAVIASIAIAMRYSMGVAFRSQPIRDYARGSRPTWAKLPGAIGAVSG